MKSLLTVGIFGLLSVMTTIVVLEVSLNSDAFGQENKKEFDMVLLNQKYNSIGLFADEIVGEILNNGTATAKSVEITAIFYDNQGRVIGDESDGTNPSTINPGDRSAFTIEILDEGIKSNSSGYDFTVKWQDEDSFNYFTRLTGDITDDSGGDNDDDDDDDNN